MIGAMPGPVDHKRRLLLIVALATTVGVAVGVGAWRLRHNGPKPFDPDQHLRLVATIPGTGIGPPDLVSVAPDPKPVGTVSFGDTELLVVTFDGLIRNLGPGPLDIYGNPNSDNDVDAPHQRVWDGDSWTPADRPPIRFESADGHNHFHFLQIARYSLWNETSSTRIAPSNKVGFCLIDSIQDDPDAARGYFSDDGNYCRQGSPEASVLRMGISPGFSDLYASDVALQWVDLSDVEPGRYRVAAEVDPFDLVEEADESNNRIAFALSLTVVPGHRATPMVVAGNGVIEIELGAESYGPVTDPAFRITSLPRHGTLQLAPDGVTARYRVDPDYFGSDSFRYAAVDPDSPYPITPVEATVLISNGPGDPTPAIAITRTRSAIHTDGVLQLGFISTDANPGRVVEWSVNGLAGGSVETGTIESDGTYHAPSEPVGAVVIAARSGRLSDEVTVDVVSPPNHRPFIEAPVEYLPLTDAAASQEKAPVTVIKKGEQVGFIIPATDPNGDLLTFGASGLPPGLSINEATGFVSGKPTRRGAYRVTFTADDATSVSSIEVTLTVE